jgi:hypothetical protein
MERFPLFQIQLSDEVIVDSKCLFINKSEAFGFRGKLSIKNITEVLRTRLEFLSFDMRTGLPFQSNAFDVVYAHLSLHQYVVVARIDKLQQAD